MCVCVCVGGGECVFVCLCVCECVCRPEMFIYVDLLILRRTQKTLFFYHVHC